MTAVIGAQWGDEGKGKIVDILSAEYDVIARAAGGANAGHTIVVDGNKYALHLLPSGCLHGGKELVLGSSVVIHLPTLVEEIEMLKENRVDVLGRLHISETAHIVFDFHKEIDSALEEQREKIEGEGIGTTKRGIGPTYAFKALRIGMRMGDLHKDDAEIKKMIEQEAAHAKEMFGIETDPEKEWQQALAAKKMIAPAIEDTVSYIHKMKSSGKTILIEGAQAALLDLDHGTYPYVTSSSTTITGALQGLGLPPQALDSCIGVVKAYCTRVGGGPFYSEAPEEQANALRERGGEYGATTGRPRRCGWLSLKDLDCAMQLNGFTHLNITKLDVLDAEEEILVYADEVRTLPGWQESTQGLTDYDDLPENAKKYIEHIEKHTSIPVSFIGTGPGREEMIVRL